MEEEKILENKGLSFHGECAIVKADLMGETKLPDDAVEVKPDMRGRLTIAHSESGHDHYVDVLDSPQTKFYRTKNPLINYLDVAFDTHALLKHAKPIGQTDRHLDQRLEGGLYRINIQREKTPEGWRKVED